MRKVDQVIKIIQNEILLKIKRENIVIILNIKSFILSKRMKDSRSFVTNPNIIFRSLVSNHGIKSKSFPKFGTLEKIYYATNTSFSSSIIFWVSSPNN